MIFKLLQKGFSTNDGTRIQSKLQRSPVKPGVFSLPILSALRSCGTLWHYGTSPLSPPRPHVNATGEDVNTTVWTSTGDFDAACKGKIKKKKTYFTSQGGFHSNLSPRTNDPAGEQKHLWRDRGGSLTGVIVPKFQAGTSSDLVCPVLGLKIVFCYVTCRTDIKRVRAVW